MQGKTKYNSQKHQYDLHQRISLIRSIKERLEQEIEDIFDSGSVAPPGCYITRYLAKGRSSYYSYYKLQATESVFETKTDGKLSKYKHLGKAGSTNYLQALEEIHRRAKVEALNRSLEIIKQGLTDLLEEISKYSN